MKKLAKFRYAFLGLAILACLATLYLFMGFGVCYTKNEPKKSDLIGVYKPDLITRMLISKQSDSPATNSEIKLGADGKIELIHMMHWLGDGDTNMAGERLVSTNGTWHLEKLDKGWGIVSEYTQSDGSMTIYLQLVGEKTPYKIQIYNWQTAVPFYFVQGTN